MASDKDELIVEKFDWINKSKEWFQIFQSFLHSLGDSDVHEFHHNKNLSLMNLPITTSLRNERTPLFYIYVPKSIKKKYVVGSSVLNEL